MNAIATKPKPAKHRKPAIRAPQLPKPIEDAGLALRFARGEVVVDRTAADPTNPNRTIARARFQPHYETMFLRHRLTREQFEAAQHYAVLSEVSLGARWQNGEKNGASAPPWMRENATVNQMAALKSLRDVRSAIGNRGRLMLDMLVLQNLSATEIGREFAPLDPLTRRRVPLDKRDVYGRLSAILDRMVEHWGGEVGNLPRGCE